MSDIDDKLSNYERGKINDQCGHLIFSLYPISVNVKSKVAT